MAGNMCQFQKKAPAMVTSRCLTFVLCFFFFVIVSTSIEYHNNIENQKLKSDLVLS